MPAVSRVANVRTQSAAYYAADITDHYADAAIRYFARHVATLALCFAATYCLCFTLIIA